MARYYDRDGYPVQPRRSILETIAYLLAFAIIGVTLFLAYPSLRAQIAGAPGREQPITRPTLPPYRGDPPFEQPAVAPADAIANYNATAEAQYRAAIAPEATPVPNTDNTGDTAPLIHMEKPADDRQPAGDKVPTAEPVNNGIGSKPIGGPINIQETHQCLHGQVWTDSGCHRPTPVQ